MRQMGRTQFIKNKDYSGVRLRCKECGIVRLTLHELRKLVSDKLKSRRCPKCGAVGELV
jgi:uncharacterized OB-fold protein